MIYITAISGDTDDIEPKPGYEEIIKRADEVWERMLSTGDFKLRHEWINLMNEAIIIENISDFSDE